MEREAKEKRMEVQSREDDRLRDEAWGISEIRIGIWSWMEMICHSQFVGCLEPEAPFCNFVFGDFTISEGWARGRWILT